MFSTFATLGPVTTDERPLRRDAQRNRQRILDAAAQLFATRGLGVSLDDIAEAAGVGVGTVYRRFPKKEELIDALFEDRVGALVALADEALGADDPWDGFVGFMERASARHVADRGLQQVVLGSAQGRGQVARARDQLAPRVSELVRRAQATGDLRADLVPTDVPAMQFMIAAGALYTGSVAPEHWRRMLGLLLDGLRSDRAAPTPLPRNGLSVDEFARAMETAPF